MKGGAHGAVNRGVHMEKPKFRQVLLRFEGDDALAFSLSAVRMAALLRIAGECEPLLPPQGDPPDVFVITVLVPTVEVSISLSADSAVSAVSADSAASYRWC